VQFVEPAQEEQVGDLLDHFELDMPPDQNAFQIWSIWLLMAPVIMGLQSCL
jgi:hypothetical protein